MEDSAKDRRPHINTAIFNQAIPPKYPSASYLPSRSSQNAFQTTDASPSPDTAVPTGGRWRFNNSGQLVDKDAEAASWELADEIVRLKISNGIDSGDDLHSAIRTPPKNKGAAAIVQVHETSPLETSSDASIDSGSSPNPSDQHLNIASHSRESSTDTASSSRLSGNNNTLQSQSLKVNTSEHRDRPHSFSGGLSSADLRRLQTAGDNPSDGNQDQWGSGIMSAVDRPEQTTYPSLTGYGAPQGSRHGPSRQDEFQVDYAIPQRQYQSDDTHGQNPTFPGSRNVNAMPSYRPQPQPQQPRGFNPQMQGMVPNAANVGYGAPAPSHTSHLSLGSTQQLYDMMVPLHDNPALARVQQQHNVFRPAHQHSTSDPLHLREAAAAMMNGGMAPFAAPGMYPAAMPPQAMGMYPNQFYPPQDGYQNPGVAAQVMAAARLQSQYPGYGVGMPAQELQSGLTSPSGSLNGSLSVDPSGNGPSANNRKLGLYKTELCRSWEEKGTCRYGPKCQFAHGEEEIRKVSRHPKYKTEICRTFWVSGSCPYGKRCCFIHTELPASGAPPGADGAPPPKVTEATRSRSDSDSNEPPVSLLARISAKRNQDNTNAAANATPTNTHSNDSSPNGYQSGSRPPTGALRVDTSSLDQPNLKHQNKSAYPSFAANGVLFANETSGNRSPGPVTAGPDLGPRSRPDFASYTQTQSRLNNSTSSSNSNIRHSYTGSNEMNTPAASGHTSPFPGENANNSTGRVGGHSRGSSVGNWGGVSRSGHLAAPSPFGGPQSANPGAEVQARYNTPWLSPEVGPSRYAEKGWA
ncbi:uncharacterized protein STEHIDRAFT_160055 [Stereum hirsutum FP-91666 SS1]|uniref:uncharacterized protein n=1 Tax=Stereum hirsutum (strain FP-91666) TaxID=721885 RepID=UPI0004449D6A|nr:uncharacterized protein STEHIDRAFT_160055 [Stereum hirsutum FP-91666 SS1]EIM83474.1 hypothetical protein STEHIDRAFT_160055 [Stereum hirsutum FP-91666 SS1]